MVNFNGSIIKDSTAVLNISNRAFKYGDGLFETIKVQNLNVIFLEDHYFRLMASMRMLRMEIPMSFTMEFLEQEILKTIKENELLDARVRVTVFRGNGGLYTPENNNVDFIIEASQLKRAVKKDYIIDLFRDYYIYSGLLSTVKTTNKLTNVLASIYADENEFDNCVLLNERKHVVEAINGNIFLVKGTVVKTPAIEEGCVKGIIRKKIIGLISKHPGLEIEETAISPFELQKADEVFITNAITGIQPVSNYKKANYKNEISQEISEMLATLI